VNYYETKHTYVAFMPYEVRTRLEGLGEDAWEPYVRLAHELEKLRRYLGAVADLRGIAPFEPLLDDYLTRHPGAIREDALDSVLADWELVRGGRVHH